jgi:hypothetical protein
MLDFLSRYVSAISLAVAVALSVFNIGYYWNIGLHFLGLADLTNLVYSAGLSFAVLSVWGGIIVAIARNEFSMPSLLAGIAGSAMLSTWGLWHIEVRGPDPQLFENLITLIGFAMGGAYFLAFMRQRRKASGAWDYKDLVVVAFSLFTTTFQAGVCAAAIERTDRITYTVNTKSGVMTDARVLRSGAAGFLLVVDGNVMFVPHGEIRSVRSELRLR